MVPRMASWLHDHSHLAAETSGDVVAHFDFHPINVLWNGRDEMVVIDWDNASLGDPVADIAATVEIVALAGAVVPNRLASRAVGGVASMLSRRMLRSYRHRRGIDDAALRYWRVVQLTNAAIWSAGREHLGSRVRTELASAAQGWSMDQLLEARFVTLTEK